MTASFVRLRALGRTFAITATLALAAACGSSEVGSDVLAAIEPGTSRDAVLATMGTGPLSATGADTVRVVNGFRTMRYFLNGKNFEVLYFRSQPGDVSEDVEQALETPVVLLDDKALGWGWKYYVEAMQTYGLPTPLKEKVARPAPAADSAPAADKPSA